MKSLLKSSPTRLGQLSSIIIVSLLLSVFMTGNAQAKKVKPQPAPPIGSDNLVRWGGDEPTPGIVEADYRSCSLSSAAMDMSSGTYTCTSSGYKVFYDFSNLICGIAHKHGDDWRCITKGSQYYTEPDLGYSYSWNGDCTSEVGCDVTVVNRFSNVAILGGPVTRVRIDPDLDRLTLEGFGRIKNNATANPFDMPQSLVIDYMHLTFIGDTGKGKVLSICWLLPLHEDFPVTFETMIDSN